MLFKVPDNVWQWGTVEFQPSRRVLVNQLGFRECKRLGSRVSSEAREHELDPASTRIEGGHTEIHTLNVRSDA